MDMTRTSKRGAGGWLPIVFRGERMREEEREEENKKFSFSACMSAYTLYIKRKRYVLRMYSVPSGFSSHDLRYWHD